MNVNKKQLKTIIEASELSHAAKETLYQLIPEADDPEIKKQIMQIIEFDAMMAESLADEMQEIAILTHATQRQIETLEKFEEQEGAVVEQQLLDMQQQLEKVSAE